MTSVLFAGQHRTQIDSEAAQDIQQNITLEDVQSQKKIDDTPKTDLGPNAEIWKIYVQETDRADKEVVEGWNNSLDVLLIFAALFSAISTAFILESTKDLKPDYTEVSAHILAAVLVTLSSRSPANSADIPIVEQHLFSPSSAAIKVNILWFTSLSLSVTVALIAIVAKDWCYQFMSARSGQALLRGRRRQLRWEGIEQWKMKEIISVLPLMMHTALLLFAVGLSLYLWNINPQVALPVIAITIVVGLFYIITLFLPLLFRYCPYTTGVVRLLLPFWYRVAPSIFKRVLEALGWLLVPVATAVEVVKQCLKRGSSPRLNLQFGELKSELHMRPAEISFGRSWNNSANWITSLLERVSGSIAADRSRLEDQYTPMDRVTSLMLGWMITQCEDVQSVDVALHALASAKLWLPSEPLAQCGALDIAVTRLNTCIAAWRHSTIVKDGSAERLKKSILLQSQSLSVISCTERIELPQGYLETVCELHRLIYQDWNEDLNHQQASKELGSLLLHLPQKWDTCDFFEEKRRKQWALVKMIVNHEVTNISATHISHLVNGIAKSYIYAPDQESTSLIKLLIIQPYTQDKELRRMISIALTLSHIEEHGISNLDPIDNRASQRSQAMKIYLDLTTTPPTDNRWHVYEWRLLHGLLCALAGCLELENNIGLQTIMDIIYDKEHNNLRPDNFHRAYLALPQRSLNNLFRIAFPDTLSGARITPLGITLPSHAHNGNMIEIRDALPIATLEPDQEDSSNPASIDLDNPHRLKLAHSLLLFAKTVSGEYFHQDGGTPWSPATNELHSVLDSIIQSNLHVYVHRAIPSETDDLVLQSMFFLWVFTRTLLSKWRKSQSTGLDVPSILSALDAPQGSLPVDVGGMGYTARWIERIRLVAKRNPQSVLESDILYWMIDFYRPYSKRNDESNTIEAFGHGPDMLGSLMQLRQECRAALRL